MLRLLSAVLGVAPLLSSRVAIAGDWSAEKLGGQVGGGDTNSTSSGGKSDRAGDNRGDGSGPFTLSPGGLHPGL
jgi:hypothetical protein